MRVDIKSPLPFTNKFSFNNRKNATLYVPQGCKAAYEAAAYWKEFKQIVESVNVDINKDGVTSINDVTALVSIILGEDNMEPYLYDHECADVNGDGDITIADITALINILK